MSTPATPWDVLLRAPRIRLQPASDEPAPQAKAGTKLARLLDELAQRDSATTMTLSVCAELSSRQVWGLLKAPREIGQVKFVAGRWSLVREFPGRDVERAAALLRSRGWSVAPPDGQQEQQA